MSEIPLGPFLGMSNRNEPYAMNVKDRGSYVQDALNVQFSDNGLISRAHGITLISGTLAGAHSLWSTGSRTYYVQSSKLYRIDTFAPFTSTELTTLTSNAYATFAKLNGDIWVSNGTDFLRLDASDNVSPHALATPATPTVSTTSGTLPKGGYRTSISYINASGEESATTPPVDTELTVAGGLLVTLPGGTIGATHIRVYVSGQNADVLTLHATVAVGTTSVVINTPTAGATPSTTFLAPLPAGRLAIYNGRLLSAVGPILYYSEPWNFGLYNPSEGYIPFAADVSVVAPAQNGVYVAADLTRWFAGPDIAKPDTIQDVLPYGAVPGQPFAAIAKPLVGWIGHKGAVVGDTQGQVKNIQEESMWLDHSASTHAATAVYFCTSAVMLRSSLA